MVSEVVAGTHPGPQGRKGKRPPELTRGARAGQRPKGVIGRERRKK